MRNTILTHISQDTDHLCIDVKLGMIVSGKRNKNWVGFFLFASYLC